MIPLRQRMLEDMQIRHLSPRTQRSYVEHVSRFARHVGRSPALLGLEEIRAYQVYLTNEKQLAPASLNVAVAALRFLYTVTLRRGWAVEAVIPAPKVPDRLPVVLSATEVVQFLASVHAPKHRTMTIGRIRAVSARLPLARLTSHPLPEAATRRCPGRRRPGTAPQ